MHSGDQKFDRRLPTEAMSVPKQEGASEREIGVAYPAGHRIYQIRLKDDVPQALTFATSFTFWANR